MAKVRPRKIGFLGLFLDNKPQPSKRFFTVENITLKTILSQVEKLKIIEKKLIFNRQRLRMRNSEVAALFLLNILKQNVITNIFIKNIENS